MPKKKKKGKVKKKYLKREKVKNQKKGKLMKIRS